MINHPQPWIVRLVALGACREAVDWARDYPSLRAAWTACERADWMLWLAGRVSGAPWSDTRRPLVLAACDCAETIIPAITDEYDAAVATSTIQTARAWAHGEASPEDVCASASAAAASAAAYALRDMADLVRAHYPEPPVLP